MQETYPKKNKTNCRASMIASFLKKVREYCTDLQKTLRNLDLEKAVSLILGWGGIFSNAVGLFVAVFSNLSLLKEGHVVPFLRINTATAISLSVNIVLLSIFCYKKKDYKTFTIITIMINGLFNFPMMIVSIGFLFYFYYPILAAFIGFSGLKISQFFLSFLTIGIADILFLRSAKDGVDITVGTLSVVHAKYIIPPTVTFILINVLSFVLHQIYLQDKRKILENEEKLKKLANRDGLTGAYNRRILEEDLEVKDIKAIAMIDIDNFKSINDTYGHLKGDDVLISLVQLLYDARTFNFQVYRYGGEEFCILSCLPRNETLQLIEKFINDVRANLRVKGQPVTVSIGVSTDFSKLDKETMKVAADDYLYKAKKNGKNKACVDDVFMFEV